MNKSCGELQGTGCREGEARAGRGACLGRCAQEAGTVPPLRSGELLRNLPEEYFSLKLTVPAYGKHGSSIAHVNSPWI